MKQFIAFMAFTIILFVCFEFGYSMTSSELNITSPKINPPISESTTSDNSYPEYRRESSSTPAIEDFPNADYSLTYRMPGGSDVQLSKYKGKTIFLYFWRTTCAPSSGGLSNVQKLYNMVKKEDVVFLCLSDENEVKLNDFMNKTSIPVYYFSGNLPAIYRHEYVPATYIISKEGKVILGVEGYTKWNQQKYADAIHRLTQKYPYRSETPQSFLRDSESRSNTSSSARKETGAYAENNFLLKPLRGKPINLSDFKGRVVLVHFWSTWCGPSIGSLGELYSLEKRLQQYGVVVLNVSDEDEQTVDKFIGGNKNGFFTYDEDLPDAFDHDYLPTTFVLTREGKIVAKVEGSVLWSLPDYVEAIKRLAQKKTTSEPPGKLNLQN